jgi:hypothetical protein
MATKDLFSDIDVLNALNNTVITENTTSDGIIIDTRGFESLTFILNVRARSAGAVQLNVQHADTNSGGAMVNVDDDNLIGTEAGTSLNAANTLARIGYAGKKRYVRIQAVATGTANMTYNATAILGHPLRAAVAQ